MRINDLIGIGIGPFNLGLASLTDPIEDLDAIFLEARDEFSWHPGMLLDEATIQVPFLADLVTMADPTSPYSFLNYLKQTGRIYPFYIRESFYPLRREYDAYCRWVCDQLRTLRFGQRVTAVRYHPGHDAYQVIADHRGSEVQHWARRLAVGIGTEPWLPDAVGGLPGTVLHSSDYLHRKEELQQRPAITIVGSGQSAAEIYLDLLADIEQHDYRLDWFTRSPRFFPMEYTKLTLEMTSPEYTSYFHQLAAPLRAELLDQQRGLYKGISSDLINAIYDTLYAKSVAGPPPTRLLTGVELVAANGAEAADGHESELTLELHQIEQGRRFTAKTSAIVCATGYRPRRPDFLEPIVDQIAIGADGRPDVARDYSVDGGRGRIFVQNGEEHTHGLSAPDLGLGAYRNSMIIAGILGREVYPIERRIAFQDFGVPAMSGPEPERVPHREELSA
ncbi:lysine N(6)-hydroxylase/L-ornithine N(5)-oxygenase family protein [Microlunatus soli]|uniref:L-lysine N6-monooxygenase MbtG n=1 Tax=Microlunatus soli TaxID=630515 RepID=A0A1H1Q525_9ACTN|nr:SidA/IucD/PvdA family monooxygenase [Microlunatus soli]SDS18474.1 lysine N6-hydroxylase [Microlunatus soli]